MRTNFAHVRKHLTLKVTAQLSFQLVISLHHANVLRCWYIRMSGHIQPLISSLPFWKLQAYNFASIIQGQCKLQCAIRRSGQD